MRYYPKYIMQEGCPYVHVSCLKHFLFAENRSYSKTYLRVNKLYKARYGFLLVTGLC